MSRLLTTITTIFLILLALAILGGLVWGNTFYARAHPGETDFLIPWLGARTFLQYGDSPYSEPATQRAQIVHYGRLASEEEDPLRLAVPMPMELFYLPFAFISDYAVARGLWMTICEIALVALALLSLKLTDWKPFRLILPVVLLFTIFWVYGAFSLLSGSAVALVALAVAGALFALRFERDELAGALLVLPAFSPTITGMLVFFIMWWCIYRRRWRVLVGFLMLFVLILAISFFILPGWFLPWLRAILIQTAITPDLSSIRIIASWSPFVGLRLGWALTAGLLLLLLVEWGIARRKGFRHFLWVVCLTLSVTPLLGIHLSLTDHVVLFLPLIMFLAIFAERWSRPGSRWLAGLGLLVVFVGLWFITIFLTAAGAFMAAGETLFLLLPLLLILGLYWIRWWAIRAELELSR